MSNVLTAVDKFIATAKTDVEKAEADLKKDVLAASSEIDLIKAHLQLIGTVAGIALLFGVAIGYFL